MTAAVNNTSRGEGSWYPEWMERNTKKMNWDQNFLVGKAQSPGKGKGESSQARGLQEKGKQVRFTGVWGAKHIEHAESLQCMGYKKEEHSQGRSSPSKRKKTWIQGGRRSSSEFLKKEEGVKREGNAQPVGGEGSGFLFAKRLASGSRGDPEGRGGGKGKLQRVGQKGGGA